MFGLEFFENANRLLERGLAPGREHEPVARLRLAPTPSRVIHRENKLRVLLYEETASATPRAKKKDSPPILLVPSLINRHYILDLMPGKSLVRFLLDQGYTVAVIDWGTPGDEDRFVSFERYVDSYLHRAIAALRRSVGLSPMGGAILIGYCLGGTMAAIHAALRPKNVVGLVALTAPIDFHNSGLLSAWCRTTAYDVKGLLDAYGNAPWSLLQTSFQWLRPTLNASRALHLLRRSKDRDFVDGSTALEVWVNDNVAFPGECYREFIEQFYRENALVNGTFHVGGRKVDFKNLTCPVLNVAASDDHIVPREASDAFRKIAHGDDYTDLLTPGGHIGAVISRKATMNLWPKLDTWLTERFVARDVPVTDNGLMSKVTIKKTSSRRRARPWQDLTQA